VWRIAPGAFARGMHDLVAGLRAGVAGRVTARVASRVRTGAAGRVTARVTGRVRTRPTGGVVSRRTAGVGGSKELGAVRIDLVLAAGRYQERAERGAIQGLALRGGNTRGVGIAEPD
jgi:hypothetical protein